MTEPTFYAESELAELLRVTKGTLATWRRDGTGPAYTHIPEQYIYFRANVEAWLTKQEDPRVPQPPQPA